MVTATNLSLPIPKHKEFNMASGYGPAQFAALKSNINTNNTQLFQDFKANPGDSELQQQIANFYNALNSPDYWVWKPTISRADVYHKLGPDATFWDWGTFKTQSAGEQGAWAQMFMGDVGPIGLTNFRSGVLAIFSGSGAQATQRTHVFAAGRRKATVAEKLFAVAVSNPPANTGNASGDARGATTNPDNLVVDGLLSGPDVFAAWAS